jgi:hypothetical protein
MEEENDGFEGRGCQRANGGYFENLLKIHFQKHFKNNQSIRKIILWLRLMFCQMKNPFPCYEITVFSML